MKKENRLLKNADFKKVLNKKMCVSREKYALYYQRNDLNNCRVGISVSSKLGNSVIRHRIKRQVVSMIDHCLDYNLNYDFVIIVRKKYLESNYNDNYEELKKIVYKILKEKS